MVTVEGVLFFEDSRLNAADRDHITEIFCRALLAQEPVKRLFAAGPNGFDFQRRMLTLESFDDIVGVARSPRRVENHAAFLPGLFKVLRASYLAVEAEGNNESPSPCRFHGRSPSLVTC